MNNQYNTIKEAIHYIAGNFKSQPTLDNIALHLGMSTFHLQRIFSEWVGISPKRFLQYMTLEYARKLLDDSRSVLDATFESGLSSPGRIHDLFVTIDAVTPGEYKKKGEGLQIMYGVHFSPFGHVLVAVTSKGICGLSFHEENKWQEGLEYLSYRWGNAVLQEDSNMTMPFYNRIFAGNPSENLNPLPLVVKGTNFQLKVWEALLQIPEGFVCSYQDIARWIGKPSASRAVGSAVGANPISYLIPCHRVIQNSGISGNYHWNLTRKKAMLLWEAVQKSKQIMDV